MIFHKSILMKNTFMKKYIFFANKKLSVIFATLLQIKTKGNIDQWFRGIPFDKTGGP
jgi:hypothetical protein